MVPGPGAPMAAGVMPSSMSQPQAPVAGASQEPPGEQYAASQVPPLSHYYPGPLYQQQPQSNNAPTSDGARPSSPVPMTYLPPPPPPLGNPYASPGYWHSQHAQPFQSPFCNSQQTPSFGGVEGSPFRVQHERTSSIPQQMPMPGGGGGGGFVPPFLQGGAYPPYQMPSFAPQGGLNAGIDVQGAPPYCRPTHLGMAPNPGAKEGGFALLSPSGVTASSMQVNAPTSPPSAQSVNLQPSGTETQNQNEPTSTNNNAPLSVPPSQPSGGAAASVVVTAVSGETQQGNPEALGVSSAGTAGVKRSREGEAAKEGGATGGGQDGDEESMSSLPMSLPDQHR